MRIKPFLLLSAIILLITDLFSQEYLYWSDTYQSVIYRQDMNQDLEPEIILSESEVFYHAIDYNLDKIYWSDLGTNNVFVSNLDGSEQEIFLADIYSPKGLALDSVGNIYLAHSNNISKFNQEGDLIGNLFSGMSRDPSALHIHNSHLYFGYDHWDFTNLNRCNLDGSANRAMVREIVSLSEIEVDDNTGEIYWTQSPGNSVHNGLFKSDADGSNKRRLKSQGTLGVEIDEENGHIYWAESIFSGIRRADLETFSNEVLIEGWSWPLFTPSMISLDPTSEKIYFSVYGRGALLYRCDKSSSNLELLARTSVYHPSQFTIDTLNELIFWVNNPRDEYSLDNKALLRSNLDGSDIVVIDNENMERPIGIEIDPTNEIIYYSDTEMGTISSIKYDGTNVTTLISGQIYPYSIQLVEDQIYWSDPRAKKILRANKDGTNIEEIFSDSIIEPYGIDYLPLTNELYWTDLENHEILKTDLISFNTVSVADTFDSTWDQPKNLFIDEQNNELYCTVGFSGDRIDKFSLEDFSVETIVPKVNYREPSDIFIYRKAPSSTLETEDLVLTIYPNPVTSFIHMSTDLENISNYKIVNNVGKTIGSGKILSSTPVYIGYFTSGVYYLILQDEKAKTIAVKKFYKS